MEERRSAAATKTAVDGAAERHPRRSVWLLAVGLERRAVDDEAPRRRERCRGAGDRGGRGGEELNGGKEEGWRKIDLGGVTKNREDD